MSRLNALDIIAAVLVIVGGLNWGLVGLFDFNLVAAIFGTASMVASIVYILVALAAIYLISIFANFDRKCEIRPQQQMKMS
jgi:uncharacterized protein